MIEQTVTQELPGIERTLLRPREVVASTGLSRVTVYNLIASGDLPSVRIGRAIRIPVQALKDWIDRKANESE